MEFVNFKPFEAQPVCLTPLGRPCTSLVMLSALACRLRWLYVSVVSASSGDVLSFVPADPLEKLVLDMLLPFVLLVINVALASGSALYAKFRYSPNGCAWRWMVSEVFFFG